MNKPDKTKRKRSAVKVTLANDGTNTPVRIQGPEEEVPKGEAELYKQAGNPLGDPNKK